MHTPTHAPASTRPEQNTTAGVERTRSIDCGKRDSLTADVRQRNESARCARSGYYGESDPSPCGDTRKQCAPSTMHPTTSQAQKFDTGKPRTDLIPPDALLEVASVFGYGAEKYAARNWELGMSWSRLYGASLRHLFAWASGENRDQESQHLTLAHAACTILMLLATTQRGIGTDDRHPPHDDA